MITRFHRFSQEELFNRRARRDSRDFLILELRFRNYLGIGVWLLEISIIDT